jgi:hypothetical protein
MKAVDDDQNADDDDVVELPQKSKKGKNREVNPTSS